MMGISVSDARDLSYWEYSAIQHTWVARHDPDNDGEDVEAPSAESWERMQAKLMASGIAGRA